MHFTNVLNIVLTLGAAAGASAAAVAPRANRKANEFSSGTCAQGTASYEHESNFNVDVTMDDTSHSVYFASGPWYFFDGKTGNGGGCTGNLLGRWNNDNDHPCVNLDGRDGDDRRIQCVRWGSAERN
ncbi:hypothetical protein CGCF415_v013036 [Colletotrichum fructicola]|uniref:Small secreted protein n=1 Tax=Colletotrichum fructicola (strain Nara gc5) TaxID=1213859 RepID=L2GCH6_COLFN|nr:uncharacterized protein CGMCC3_g12588 [Colletotrichum fructicola]KAF4476501.1 hypothetical protein CGGC5_v015297 [Colletotrichum fructicola Nara gc5]KAE9571229.1 hypothetical protein CGMCC3_g12588 [Colletotrichum fructicola]KAF4424415.1 hypothetical protein CFRS1_v013315 [Colletotrichum fructicola]KAF4888123.1 hypothetical protein CGCFRS4_v010052 [Colletotrichum fructicola]KAF4892443.1 hypothetical protein CGCF415_v013036 [Colletotrichum fructicola]